MKLKAFAKVLIMGAVLSMMFALTVSAREFVDVPKNHWAKDTIKEISDKNIIVGYTDGTFRPSKGVSKTEVFIILARVLGVNSEANANLVEQAEINYKNIMDKYPTYASREISYLLQQKVLKQDELEGFLGEGRGDSTMLRKEIVPILMRVLGKEYSIPENSIIILDYKDASSIPDNIKGYVEYLGKEGIMVNATDDNKFMPNDEITRAQIATLISRILKKMPQTADQGQNNGGVGSDAGDARKSFEGMIDEITISRKPKLTLIDDKGNTVAYELNKNVTFIVDGEDAEIYRLRLEDKVRLIFDGDEVVEVDVLN